MLLLVVETKQRTSLLHRVELLGDVAEITI